MSDDGGEITGGLAAYAESIQRKPAMSKPRVLPTEPGWWYARYRDAIPVIASVDKSSMPGLSATLGMVTFQVDDPWIEWLAPVPSREAVEAAVDAMRNAIPSCPLGVAGRLEDAIAGLIAARKNSNEKGLENASASGS